MWNAETARLQSEWYASPLGTFALAQEHKLFQHLVSCWPRRGRTLLDLGCGTGIFLDMFWDCGFDVTGVDSSEDILCQARQRLGNKAELRLGQLDHLPFDDGDFDYVALFSILEHVDEPRQVLEEAFRVAERGIVIGFVNAWSLYRLMTSLSSRKADYLYGGHWQNLFNLARICREICPGCRTSFRSVLHGPSGTWKNNLVGRLNKLSLRLPFGAYMALRIDTEAQVPMTPLLLKAKERAMSVCSGLRPEPSNRSFPGKSRSSEK